MSDERFKALQEAAAIAAGLCQPDGGEDEQWIDGTLAARDAILAAAARVDDAGGASSWRPMSTCPSDERPVWVWGGVFHEQPALREAIGSWWRSWEREGSIAVPTHWAPCEPPPPPPPPPSTSDAEPGA